MRAARCLGRSVVPSAFVGFRFPPEVITLAVRWYLRFGLSYRDVEELLAEGALTLITSPSIAGCSGSRRCSSTPRGRVGTLRVTGGSSMNVR